LKDQTPVKTTPDIYHVKQFLNLAYVLTVARLAFDAAAAAAERNRISRNEAAKRAAHDADEVARYKFKLWFESHARHTFYDSPDGRISLRARHHGATAGTPSSRKKWIALRAENQRKQDAYLGMRK
jgi:hypothetical protein